MHKAQLTQNFKNHWSQLLKKKFNDRLSSRNGYVNWLPTSCVCTPLDYLSFWKVVQKQYTINLDLQDEIICITGDNYVKMSLKK